MPDVTPGKEEEYRYLQRWLAASADLDRLIEATEPQERSRPALVPVPADSAAAVGAARPRGLRAAFASHLARLAIALHPDAATGAVLRPNTERTR